MYIYISLTNNYDKIIFPDNEFLTKKEIIINNNSNENSINIMDADEIYYIGIMKKIKLNARELFDNYVANIINLNRDLEVIKNPVLYVRSEDIIGISQKNYCLQPVYI